MNNKILAARRTSSLVRVWRSTGDPGTPLVCTWVRADSEKQRANSPDPTCDKTGGLPLCA
jgi:hypothetical protein